MSERPSGASRPAAAPPVEIETRIARLLFIGTIAGVALLLVGVLLMVVAGVDPTGGGYRPFDAGRLLSDVTAVRAEGFLWAGIVVLIGTPVARTVGELVAFGIRRDVPMTLVALAILGIIALGVALAARTEG